MLSYNQVIDKISVFAAAHKMVGQFGEGNIADVLDAPDPVIYPLVWVVPGNTNIDPDNKEITYNLNVIFADILTEDKTNERDIRSDLVQVATDLVSYLMELDSDLVVEGPFTLTPVSEDTPDFVSGWNMQLKLATPYTVDHCAIPL